MAKSFDAVLNNDIIKNTANIGYWEIVNGNDCKYYDTVLEDYVDYDSIENWNNIEEEYFDIYQYYIISGNGATILEEYTDEIIFYNEDLDMYVWGVTHYGTNWDYVLTDIKLDWK